MLHSHPKLRFRRLDGRAAPRFLLPESVRTYAGITQEAVFLGQAGRAEIWSAERYEAEEQKYLTPEALAAVMEELGF